MGYTDTKPRQKICLNTFGFLTKILNKLFLKKECYKSINLKIPITVLFVHISCPLLRVPFLLIVFFFIFFALLTPLTYVPLKANITNVNFFHIKFITLFFCAKNVLCYKIKITIKRFHKNDIHIVLTNEKKKRCLYFGGKKLSEISP